MFLSFSLSKLYGNSLVTCMEASFFFLVLRVLYTLCNLFTISRHIMTLRNCFSVMRKMKELALRLVGNHVSLCMVKTEMEDKISCIYSGTPLL